MLCANLFAQNPPLPTVLADSTSGDAVIQQQGSCSMASRAAELSRVDPRAKIARDTLIGPGCVIGPDVEIGRGTRLADQVCLLGAVRIGEFNSIGPFVAIGGEPQDLSYWGTATRTEIGDYNMIGERVTIHRGSEKEDGVTRVGSHNTLRSGAHVAHDCKLADRITIGSWSMVGGHVHIESDAYIAEQVGIHQFSTIGCSSHVGGQSKITQDVPCYMRVAGNPTSVRGINGRVLHQRRLTGPARAALRTAYHLIFLARMTLGQATEILDERDQLSPEVLRLLQFLESQHQGRLGRARERVLRV
jgi:UDP-N-acetylglucosamine acyltransferase